MAKQTTSTPQGKVVPASESRAARPRAAGAGGSGRGGDDARRRLAQTPITTYIEQSWLELKKVTWPTWPETLNLTIAVLVMTIGIAIFLGLVDALLSQIVQHLI